MVDIKNIDVAQILSEVEVLRRRPQNCELQLSLQKVDDEQYVKEIQNSTRSDIEKELMINAAQTAFIFDMPYTNSILHKLGMYRSRLLNMMPKTCYSYHTDPTMRIHIPLITDENNFFVIDDIVTRYPADGSYYLIDTTKKHTFVNASHIERLHIVGCISNDIDTTQWTPFGSPG